MNKINIKSVGLLLVFVLSFALLLGCNNKDGSTIDQVDEKRVEDMGATLSIEDKFGRSIDVDESIERIVSLAPSNTEMLFALGLGDKVVGVTDFCDYPLEAQEKEKIGGYKDQNIERIIELEPDLVVVNGMGNEDNNRILEEAGIKILGFNGQTIDEIFEDIEILSIATKTEDRAIELIEEMADRRDEILAKVSEEETVEVFYEIWHEPLKAAGKGSFMGELITLVGGINIAEDGEGNYPEYDIESLIEKNPKVYLLAEGSPENTVEAIKNRPGFDTIDAIKNDRIYMFTGDEANIVSRPGTRIIDALELVAKAIYPNAFN